MRFIKSCRMGRFESNCVSTNDEHRVIITERSIAKLLCVVKIVPCDKNGTKLAGKFYSFDTMEEIKTNDVIAKFGNIPVKLVKKTFFITY